MIKFFLNILQVFRIFSLMVILLPVTLKGIIFEHQFHWHSLGYFFLNLGANLVTAIYLGGKRHLGDSAAQASL
jgi:hypothetical protein